MHDREGLPGIDDAPDLAVPEVRQRVAASLHSLAGAAASVGAGPIAQQAHALLHQLRQRDAQPADAALALQSVLQALRRLVDAVGRALPPP